jgi:hypothetical protein
VRTLGRVVALVALTAVGFVTGIVGSFIHPYAVHLLGVGVPVGLVLALVPAVATYLLAGWLLRNRLAVLAPGAGWLVPVLVFSAPRAAGDLVVAANAAGYVFLLGGSALIGLGVALPYGSRGAALRPVP